MLREKEYLRAVYAALRLAEQAGDKEAEAILGRQLEQGADLARLEATSLRHLARGQAFTEKAFSPAG